MKVFATLFLLTLLISFNEPVLAEAPAISVSEYSVQEMITHYAKLYGANEKELMVVAKCESGFKPNAIGDGGKARNIYQYHKPTFDRFSKLLGEDLDYNSALDQIKLTSFIFAEYPQYKKHWTCFLKNFRV